MNKVTKTERTLFDALDRLVSGEPLKSDGRITQENIALEAGVSRATFNRYPKVVAEYQRVKARGAKDDEVRPFTIEDKNRELQESNTELRRNMTQAKKNYEEHLEAARQEIMILNAALRKREDTIVAKDRAIAELNRRIGEYMKSDGTHLNVVK